MSKHLICLIGAMLFWAACPAVGSAEDIPARTKSPDQPSSTQMKALKNCKFITHDCELCYIKDNGNVGCSSVGIACEPTKWSCLLSSTDK